MTLVYVDAGVLIAAARGGDEEAQRAFEILGDPELTFASSVYVQLEVLPKPVYFRLTAESEFYEAFFSQVSVWSPATEALTGRALEEATQAGLSAMDALHVAAASSAGVTELITTEGRGKPIHRSALVRTRSIRP
jgi:predicted nucleic acid-binding protein